MLPVRNLISSQIGDFGILFWHCSCEITITDLIKLSRALEVWLKDRKGPPYHSN